MPFFCMEYMRTMIPFPIADFLKKDTASLQVRIPLKIDMYRKRVCSSASASMTVEAALVLPLFLFAGVILMMPFRILDVERQMQAIIMSVGENISQAAYLTLETEKGRERAAGVQADGAAGLGTLLSGGTGSINITAAYAYAESTIRMKTIGLPVQCLSLAGSSLLEDGETVDLVVEYRMKLPFSVFGLGEVKRTNRCWLRAWIGTGGSADAGGDAETEEDPIVYVGRDSTRYHESSVCHYLYNRLSAVSVSQIENYRSDRGRRYTPCSRCGRSAKGVVYVMPSGEHYHSTRNCTAIAAYVKAVRRSSVEYLGPCSYCSGG